MLELQVIIKGEPRRMGWGRRGEERDSKNKLTLPVVTCSDVSGVVLPL